MDARRGGPAVLHGGSIAFAVADAASRYSTRPEQATANVITAGLNTQNMAGGIKVAKAGDTMLQRFEATVLDADTKQQLDLYKARRFV